MSKDNKDILIVSLGMLLCFGLIFFIAIKFECSSKSKKIKNTVPNDTIHRVMFRVRCRNKGSNVFVKQMVPDLNSIKYEPNVVECNLRKVEIKYEPVEENIK